MGVGGKNDLLCKDFKIIVITYCRFLFRLYLIGTENYIFNNIREKKDIKELPCRLTIIFSMLVTIIYLI